MVASLRDTYGIDYIYCWHGLPAYWSGISVEDPGEFVCSCLLGMKHVWGFHRCSCCCCCGSCDV